MPPKISFVIPAYNAEAFLERSVRSACAQTVDDVEVIIVDDASSDGTAALANDLAARDARIKVLSNENNKGPSGSRNKGIRAAEGEWLAVLDADDEIAPQRSRALLDLAAAASADIVADNLNLERDRGGYVGSGLVQKKRPYALVVSPELYLRQNRILKDRFQLGYLKPMYSTAFLRKANLFYDERIRIGEDFDFCLRALLQNARFVITSEPFYTYSIRESSLSSKLVRESLETLIARSQEVRGAYPAHSEGLKKAFDEYDHFLYRALAFDTFVSNLKEGAFSMALRTALHQTEIWDLILQNGPAAFFKRVGRLRRSFR